MWASPLRSKDSKTWKLDVDATPGCRPCAGHPLPALVTKPVNRGRNVSLTELGELNDIVDGKGLAKCPKLSSDTKKKKKPTNITKQNHCVAESCM